MHAADPFENPHPRRGPVLWMAENPVAANLLMFILIVGGLAISRTVKQESFPDLEIDFINITVPYPGASPEEVEQGIVLAIEEEVRGLDGVKKVYGGAYEGGGSVTVELLGSVSNNKLLQDVKNAVDRITSFPEEAERPEVSLVIGRNKVISMLIYGDHELPVLRDVAEQVRDEMLQDVEITLVELSGAPPLEIGVEIPMRTLRKHNLTLDQVARVIRDSALELPAGGVKTPMGEVLLRTVDRRDYAQEYADISIVSQNDGTVLTLGEIADLQDGFVDNGQESFFNGHPAVRLDIYRVGEQTPITVAEAVRSHVESWNGVLPGDIRIAIWDDASEFFRGRMDLLLRNAALGLTLVLLLLGLFLDPRLAFWVTLGIPVSILGAFLLIPFMGASINMISLFGFILTIGIIVDDAIMVGESVYHERQKGLSWHDASVQGTRLMIMPVHFAVLTNVLAFCPLFFVPGPPGKLFLQLPAIVVPVLLLSLVESLYVLPAHLTHGHRDTWFWRAANQPQRHFGRVLEGFIQRAYRPTVDLCLRHRYITMACALALLILSGGVVAGGYIKFSFIPRIDSDIITVDAQLPFGAPTERSRAVQAQIVRGAQAAAKEVGGDILRGVYSQLGSTIQGLGPGEGLGGATGSHLVGVQVLLVSADLRDISGVEFSRIWREKAGEIPGLESISFVASVGAGGGDPIHIQLSHRDRTILETAAQDLAESMGAYAGVTDLNDGVSEGKPQKSFRIKPEARSLGLTTLELARQVRASFYGAEALRQQRGRNEVKVMVRLPKAERDALYTVEELILRAPDGSEIALSQAAEITDGRAYNEINRTDGQRVTSVTADVDENIGNATEILADAQETVLPVLLQKYPGLSYTFEGEQRSQIETMVALGKGFALAMFAIYAMLALPFRSYVQPLIVMLSIPFGIVGALIGHLLLGYGLSIISMFGIIALAGVVVNDSLVLIVQANKYQFDEGMTAYDAVREAGVRRFRPIILTSLTTFFGLAPMIFEKSMQARFLVPMAISLGFGVLFSTLIILVLVPSAYVAVEDVKGLAKYLFGGTEEGEGE